MTETPEEAERAGRIIKAQYKTKEQLAYHIDNYQRGDYQVLDMVELTALKAILRDWEDI